jgi:protein involved in polysaccharide export with SLBB domain
MVKGEVNSPGAYPATTGVTVARLINLALGLTLKANRQEAIIYTPQGEQRKVDLTLALGEHAADYVVQPRETLVIPPVDLKQVTIIGEVGKPGKYSLAAPDDTVLDALLAAGWVGPNGDRNTALLVRDGDQPQRLPIAPLLSFQPGFTGPRLEAGDMLVVPHVENFVTVWGAVGKPGKILLGMDPTHISDLITDAGIAGNANNDTATLVHADGQSVSVDLKIVMDNPTDPLNLVVTAGDTLIVGTRQNQVELLGYVARPGPVPFVRDDRLLDVLTRGGGLAPTGDLDNVTLLRPGQPPVTMSIRKLMREGDQTNNLPMQVGDTIVVAEAKHEIYVFGNVGTPGKYPFEENDRVLDIIAKVGLDKQNGAPWEAALIRRDPKNPKLADVMHVDLDKLMVGQKQDENYLVQNGDIFVVPKRHGTNWLEWVQQLFGFIGMVDIFGTPFR